MKKSLKTRLLAWILCFVLAAAMLPGTAWADAGEAQGAEQLAGEPEDHHHSMTAGDIYKNFAAAGAKAESSDKTVAWVDADGNLRAMKAGDVTITTDTDVWTVHVDSFVDDDSSVVGNLKLLARYNDSMQFYDGHVYLLFTSYQDNVTVAVPDLYGAYEISDQYYTDIRENLANGSNHTGNDADKYFTFTDKKSFNLNRGQIVTIGMYRGFDLTVPQAALGTIRNSSAWAKLSAAGKTAAVESLFKFLDDRKVDTEEVKTKLQEIFKEIGLDYNTLVDGVVEGGVCFNRELYNQKLEWDQYENVTYELDITKEQLDRLQMYLQGNLGRFNILKNSCATVALRAWNAAVGTRDGEDTAYKLSAEGKGIYAFVDAPKGVRDSIVANLPGYCLNNAAGVAEAGAGFQDDTGWVYVSAPKAVTPANYSYVGDDTIQIDTARSDIGSLIGQAFGGKIPAYHKDEQMVDVTVSYNRIAEQTEVTEFAFTVNENTGTIPTGTVFADGLWLKVACGDPTAYVVDDTEKVLPSVYADGCLSFRVSGLPAKFIVKTGAEGSSNILKIVHTGSTEASFTEQIYYDQDETKVTVNDGDAIPAGTKVFVKVTPNFYENEHVLAELSVNGTSILTLENYDSDEEAFFVTMPPAYATLTLRYAAAKVEKVRDGDYLQAFVGDVLSAADYSRLVYADGSVDAGAFIWDGFSDGSAELKGKDLEIRQPGGAFLSAKPLGNTNLYAGIALLSYESREGMVTVTYPEDQDIDVCYVDPGQEVRRENEKGVHFSGFMVPAGSVLIFRNDTTKADHRATAKVVCNGTKIKPGETYVAAKDVNVELESLPAVITGLPSVIRLKEQGATCQLKAKVQYPGLKNKLRKVYDPSITYNSSDPLVTVENGVLTVAGEIPAEGKIVTVTATAGSSNDKVTAAAKVYVGSPDGGKIVGKLTINARRISEEEITPHGALTFQTYEDITFPVSYYEYNKPNEKYSALLQDYEEHKENYKHDPAINYDNELGLTDRESYFDTTTPGAKSEPRDVTLKAGEAISMSCYAFGGTKLETFMEALDNSLLYYFSSETRELVEQIRYFLNNGTLEAPVETFDNLLTAVKMMYGIIRETKLNPTGLNPANGETVGGLILNREMYNQFRRNDTQFPNFYWQIEITADELANLKAYLANPENNYYALFTMNCATGVVDIWNETLSDHPELHLTGNLTGFTADPQSLYFDLARLQLKPGLPGKGGKDFYPRSLAWANANGISLSKESLSLKAGTSSLLTARVHPDNARDKTVTWTSENPDIATVDAKGRVKGIAEGKTVVYASTANGFTASCAVSVAGTHAEKVTLSAKSKSLYVGLTAKLKATISPKKAAEKTVAWESSNPEVATVSKSGLVTAVRGGTCTVTATTENGVKASCKITVKQKYIDQAERKGIYRLSVSTANTKLLKDAGWSCKKAFRAAGVSNTKVYWLYDRHLKCYRYTTNREFAIETKKAGNRAGFAFYASDKASVPVYELCKEGSRVTFFYTISLEKVSELENQGWKNFGVAWYSEPASLA